MRSATPFVPSINRPSITDATLSLILAVAHFDTVGEYAGEKSSRAYNAQQEAQGALYSAIDAEIRRDRSGIPALFTLPAHPAPAADPITVARQFGMVDPLAPAGRNNVLKSLLEAYSVAQERCAKLPETVENTPEMDAALQLCTDAQESLCDQIDSMLYEARNVGAAAVLNAPTVPTVPCVSDYAGIGEALEDHGRTSAIFNALDAPQGTEEYAKAEAEIGRTWSELADFLNSMLFDAYWKGRRAQAEEAKEAAGETQPAPAAPAVPTVEAFGSVPRGGLHGLLNLTLQNLRYDDLFAAAQEAGAAWSAAVLAGSPEADARREVYHAARKAVRAAVVQFGSQTYLSGVEEGKK